MMAVKKAPLPPVEVLCVGDSDVYSCGICYDWFKDAMAVIPCGHSFCGTCAKQVKKCPFCKAAIRGLQPNYSLRQVVEHMPVRCPGYFQPNGANGWERRSTLSACESIVTKATLEAHIKSCPHSAMPDNIDQYMLAKAKRRRMMNQSTSVNSGTSAQSAPARAEVIVLE